jgi:hypothetical protein
MSVWLVYTTAQLMVSTIIQLYCTVTKVLQLNVHLAPTHHHRRVTSKICKAALQAASGRHVKDKGTRLSTDMHCKGQQ